MWRVLLSVFAAGFDGLMIAIMLIMLPEQMAPHVYRIPPHAVMASASTQHNMQLAAALSLGFIIGGFVLNLLAIAFGARLRFGRAAERAAVAAEFA
jgi:hypothetical protein